MRVLTWNVQATKGCDDQFDIERIQSVIRSFGDVQVVCLQEVSRNIPEYGGNDQKQLFESSFEGYASVWASAYCVENSKGQEEQFGNLTLVRDGFLLDARIHCLPWPAETVPQIPRCAAEVLVRMGDSTITIINTHLAFHSAAERRLQTLRLTELRDQSVARRKNSQASNGIGAFRLPPTAEALMLCGDLNIALESDEYRELTEVHGWSDFWNAQKRSTTSTPKDRLPTCGCYDHILWPQGPHVRDFFLGTSNLMNKVKHIEVNLETDASDHQPLLIELFE